MSIIIESVLTILSTRSFCMPARNCLAKKLGVRSASLVREDFYSISVVNALPVNSGTTSSYSDANAPDLSDSTIVFLLDDITLVEFDALISVVVLPFSR